MPLSLLASEAIANALKYIGHDPGKTPLLAIRLSLATNSTASFEMENSKGSELISSDRSKGSGLGNALIAALADQAGGTIQVFDEPHRYCLRVDFPIVDYQPGPVFTFIKPAD